MQEVTQYRSDALYSKQSIEYAKEFLDSAQQEFDVELMRYKVGTNNIVELINAQTSVANARAKLIGAIRSWFTSLANLSYASGIAQCSVRGCIA